MGSISLQKVVKKFGSLAVIPEIDLEIEDGQFVVFVGPSGCGKSTLLRLIAGLEDMTSGSVLISGTDVSTKAPGDRGLAMVFQSYALYPHMSVADNILFPLRTAKVPEQEAKRKLEKAADILNLRDLLDRKPAQLSGGQRQRVAIGRAIVREPAAFLFDEPLSNLDAALRVNMRLEIAELHQQLGTTMIYVTHDQVEAMTMADKIVVLNAGKIEQVGAPLELYKKPVNRFVAGFIGSPKMNFIEGEEAEKQNAAIIGIRPEHMEISRESGLWQGRVGASEHLGSDTFLHVETSSGTLNVRAAGEMDLYRGDNIWMSPQAGSLHRFDQAGRAIETI